MVCVLFCILLVVQSSQVAGKTGKIVVCVHITATALLLVNLESYADQQSMQSVESVHISSHHGYFHAVGHEFCS